ncbi:MAG: cytochrome c oxidase subunit II [Phycisphaerae bacterium]
MLDFRLVPEDASTIAARTDALYAFLVAVAVFFSALVFILVTVFAVKYRRRPGVKAAPTGHGHLLLEVTWIVIPFILVMIMFVWGAKLFIRIRQPPPDAMEINVVARQWMWKLQHPNGRREINELHVPAGVPVRLRMVSEDVIHSFYVPAFRLKQDVLPGTYMSLWFEPTKPGEYHLFCAEYCGMEHAGMKGRVVVMEPEEYQKWLTAGPPVQSMADAGRELFVTRAGCQSCHSPTSGGRGPDLAGVYGRRRELNDGRSVLADESYLRESILRPDSHLLAGYGDRSLMPPYLGQLSEDDVIQLIAYIKSLPRNGAARADAASVRDQAPPAPAATRPAES